MQFFRSLARQWDIVAGMGNAYYQGLRLEAIGELLRTCRVPPREREKMMDDLLLMSDAASEILNQR